MGDVPVPELETHLDPAIAARLKRDANGLVAAIVREHATGDVLMMAWMDDEALHRTLTTGRATYWSRSRRAYWGKGAPPGHRPRGRHVRPGSDGGAAPYGPRSRREAWVKGETSGHRQWVRDVRLDCDGDALLVLVDQEGPACPTGERSRFHRELGATRADGRDLPVG